MKPGRNDPCSCGSGKKYRHCCEGKAASRSAAPSPDELNQLVALFNTRRYAELENRARSSVGQYPGSGLAWKLLGASLQMQGKDALTAFQKTAELMPGDAEAHFNLGNALKDLGHPDAAVASFRRALELRPDSAETHYNLGATLKILGQLDNAVASYRRALELKPDSAYVHFNLGNALKSLGQLDDAAASYRRALQIKPDFADAHNNLGAVLKDLGQFDAAAASYRLLIALKPDSAEAHYCLGNVLRDSGQLESAMASYRRAVELKPEFTDAHLNLGTVLLELGQFDHAEASFRRVLEIDPDSAVVHSYLGHALKALGQFDSAVDSYHRALEIDPKCIVAMLGLGYLYAAKGETAKIEKIYRDVLEVDAGNLEAHFMLVNFKKTQAGDKSLDALVAAEEAARNSRSPMPYYQAINLHFSLGKCFDDLGDHDRAFPHFIEGCKLKRATFTYDAAQMTQHFNNIMRVFDQATIERLRGSGNASEVPIFVLGMPRSGTTLTEQIIASHPEVHGAGELPDMMKIAQREVAGTAGFPGNIPALDQASLAKWADDYVAGLRQRAPDARHITDKMPANFSFIGLIHVMLPNAKIIHVNRNPVDTCLSCFTKLFIGVQKHTYDLAELGRYYVDYARLMDHWRNVLPAGTFLDVQYEDIVADQETQSRRLINFCGLEWDDACIDFHKNKRSVSTASLTQVRQPIYKSSVERWRPYEKYLGPLLDALGDLAQKRN